MLSLADIENIEKEVHKLKLIQSRSFRKATFGHGWISYPEEHTHNRSQQRTQTNILDRTGSTALFPSVEDLVETSLSG